jgi:hypothetical protein
MYKTLVVCLALFGVSAQAQIPAIEILDFYGLRKVKASDLRKALGLKEGDQLPPSKGDVEEAMEQVSGVVFARLEAVQSEGKTILYGGIEEKGAPHFNYLDPPAGLVKLPTVVHDEYVQFLSAIGVAVRAGEVEDDLTQGYSLMRHAGVRAHQLRFVTLAAEHQDALHKVLRESVDEEHRAIAAYVIGYSPKKPELIRPVIDALQYVLRDPDDTVRNNALRSLAGLAVYAARNPASEIRISPTWFIEMLDSLVWADRIKAIEVLLTLTEQGNPDIIGRLRERSVDTLAEMAAWRHMPHALPPFILLGRVAGMPEDAIRQAWLDSDRTAQIKVLVKSARSPSR